MSETSTENTCPFCRAAVVAEAKKCAHCGANVGDIRICPSCAEPVREAATVCPFCRGELLAKAAEAAALLSEPWIVTASPLGAFVTEQSPTALIFPPVLTITNGEINVRRKMLGGLRTLDSRIQNSRVASVRVSDGVFWAGITVETYGGAAGNISVQGLYKDEARETAALLEQIARLNSGARER